MVLAIALGVLAGAVAFLPLLIGLRLTRKAPAASPFGPMAKLLVALVISFVMAFLLAVLFIAFDKPQGLPFVLAEAIGLCAIAIVYGVWFNTSHGA